MMQLLFLIGFQLKKRFLIGLLGINIHNFLTFNEHASNLCKKPNQKLQAITRISSYLNKNKLRLIMNAFFSPHLDIAHLFGCLTIEDIMIRYTAYTNECLE